MNKIYNNLNIENFIKTEEFKKLTEDQKEELLMSSQWFNQFNKEQQNKILGGVYFNLDISIYAKLDFTDKQMKQIIWGLMDNLDVSIYAKTEFTPWQMSQIREGL